MSLREIISWDITSRKFSQCHSVIKERKVNGDVVQYLLLIFYWTVGKKFLQVYLDESLYGTAKLLTSFDFQFLNPSEELMWYGVELTADDMLIWKLNGLLRIIMITIFSINSEHSHGFWKYMLVANIVYDIFQKYICFLLNQLKVFTLLLSVSWWQVWILQCFVIIVLIC